jgi:hypothetical protein
MIMAKTRGGGARAQGWADTGGGGGGGDGAKLRRDPTPSAREVVECGTERRVVAGGGRWPTVQLNKTTKEHSVGGVGKR